MSNQYLFAASISNNHLFIVFCRNSEMLDEIMEHLSHLLWLIFMNDMTHLVEHHQFVFSLHLGNSQLSVHSVASCK